MDEWWNGCISKWDTKNKPALDKEDSLRKRKADTRERTVWFLNIAAPLVTMLAAIIFIHLAGLLSVDMLVRVVLLILGTIALMYVMAFEGSRYIRIYYDTDMTAWLNKFISVPLRLLIVALRLVVMFSVGTISVIFLRDPNADLTRVLAAATVFAAFAAVANLFLAVYQSNPTRSDVERDRNRLKHQCQSLLQLAQDIERDIRHAITPSSDLALYEIPLTKTVYVADRLKAISAAIDTLLQTQFDEYSRRLRQIDESVMPELVNARATIGQQDILKTEQGRKVEENNRKAQSNVSWAGNDAKFEQANARSPAIK
jgi:hypothetical protein